MRSPGLLLAIIVVPAAIGIAACGGENPADRPPGDGAEFVPAPPKANTERSNGEGTGQGTGVERGKRADRQDLSREIAAARRTVRTYIEAIDRRDGGLLCGLFAPRALDQLRLPEPRGSCEASLEASIGFADKRGFPVYSGSEVIELGGVAFDAASVGSADARVTALLLTRFVDRDQPSIEDDFIYLSGDAKEGFSIAKPSGNLLRAVGKPDIPPSVIAPPG